MKILLITTSSMHYSPALMFKTRSLLPFSWFSNQQIFFGIAGDFFFSVNWINCYSLGLPLLGADQNEEGSGITNVVICLCMWSFRCSHVFPYYSGHFVFQRIKWRVAKKSAPKTTVFFLICLIQENKNLYFYLNISLCSLCVYVVL
jgi:hypothetical protein